MDAGIRYCIDNDVFNDKEFESECGVGVSFSEEDITKVVDSVIDAHKDELSTTGKGLFGPLIHEVKKSLLFADGKTVSAIFNTKVKKQFMKLPIPDYI